MSYIGKQPTKAPLTASDIEDGIITAAKIEDGAVVAAEIASNAVTTAKINADAVTGAKIADDAINSEHYTDGSIDTAHIADANVTTAKITDGNVTTAKIAADAVTAAKIADDAISDEHLDPTAITGQTAETSVADDDLILISDTSASAALRKMTKSNFVSGIGGANTPIVFAKLSSSQNITNNSTTDVAFANEIIDTASAFNTSNYTFTVPSGQGGAYVVSAIVRKVNFNASRCYVDLITSGGNFVFEHGDSGNGTDYNTLGGTVITNLSASNTIKVRFYHNDASTQAITNDGTYLSIFKLIQ